MKLAQRIVRPGALALPLALLALALGSCRTPGPPERAPAAPAAAPQEPSPGPPEPSVAAEPEEQPKRDPAPSRSRGLRSRGLFAQAAARGATVSRVEGEPGLWLVAKGPRELLLREGSRQAVLDGKVLFLDRPFAKRRGVWALAESDERVALAAAFGNIDLELPQPLVAIDPGHGGAERGAVNEALGLVEKELALEVAKRLAARLEARGFRIVLTRYDDRPVSLAERAEIANRAGAALFVSIHFNAADSPEAAGVETYLLKPAGEASTAEEAPPPAEEAVAWPGNAFDQANFLFALRLQQRMTDRLQRADRGVKKARFGVLKELRAPGALVECGFLTNRSEALLVGTPVYREKLARALAEGIESFYLEYGSPSAPPQAPTSQSEAAPEP